MRSVRDWAAALSMIRMPEHKESISDKTVIRETTGERLLLFIGPLGQGLRSLTSVEHTIARMELRARPVPHPVNCIFTMYSVAFGKKAGKSLVVSLKAWVSEMTRNQSRRCDTALVVSCLQFTGSHESFLTEPGAPLAKPRFTPGFMLSPASQPG